MLAVVAVLVADYGWQQSWNLMDAVILSYIFKFGW
jgi:hypothetical protein